jgi:aminopeptidase N
VFQTVAHEIAHQWFGNLVTAASWSEIWLNEAFATWLAEKAADRFNPSWQVALHRRTPIDRTMQRDASRATRAIRAGPVTEATVFDVFDNITYTKGGAVLSMIEQWLGPAVFQRGLADYIAQRKLSNATAGDLWFHIGRAARRDVAAVAASWTDQPGFPLVRVRAACEGGRTVLQLEQRRFGFDAAQTGSAQLWQIPVRIGRGADRFTVLLTQAQAVHRLPGCSAEPVVVNAGGAGFYRVEYEGEHLDALQQRFAQLDAADQVALLSDAFALAQAGALPMPAYFGLLARVPSVPGAGRAMLLTQAADALMLLDTALAGSTAQAALRDAGRELLAPELARLGWEPGAAEPGQTLVLRAVLIEKLAHFEHAATIAHAQQLFDRDAQGTATLPASLRSAVTFAVGMHADRARFDTLVARLKAARGEEERWLHAQALAAGRDAQRVSEVLELALNSGLPSNIATSISGMVARKSPFGEQAYAFVRQRWSELAALTGREGRVWLLPGAAEGFNQTEGAARLLTDQRAAVGADGDATAGRIAARIELLAQIRQREGEDLAALLAAWRPQP